MFELKRYVACSDGQGVGFAIKRSRVRLLADSVQTVHTCFSYHQPDITICMFLPVLTPQSRLKLSQRGAPWHSWYQIWCQKTRVFGLNGSGNRMILGHQFLCHYQRVTDRQTDRLVTYS